MFDKEINDFEEHLARKVNMLVFRRGKYTDGIDDVTYCYLLLQCANEDSFVQWLANEM